MNNASKKIKILYRSPLIFLITLLMLIGAWHIVQAVVHTKLAGAVWLDRAQVTYNDVINGTSVNPALYCGDTQFADVSGNSCKKVIVNSPPAATFMIGITTNVVTAFSVSGLNTTIYATKVSVEDASGNQLSMSDVAMPPNLNTANLENRIGSSPEQKFYDESNAVNLVYYIFCRNSNTGVPTSCNSLSAGQFDVYISRSSNNI